MHINAHKKLEDKYIFIWQTMMKYSLNKFLAARQKQKQKSDFAV